MTPKTQLLATNMKLAHGMRYECRVVKGSTRLVLHDSAPGARRALLKFTIGFPATAWLIVGILWWMSGGIGLHAIGGAALLTAGTIACLVFAVYFYRMPTESRTVRIDARRRRQRLRVHEGNGPKDETMPMAFRPADELTVHEFDHRKVGAIVLLFVGSYPLVIAAFRDLSEANKYAANIRKELERLGGPC